MSDQPEDRILAAIASLRNDLRAEITTLRVDLMERMDRLQARMGSLDEQMTMGFGDDDRAERRTQAVAEDNRLLGEQMRSMLKIVRGLEGRINALEERKS